MVPEPDRPLFERPEVQAGWMACFVEACRRGVDGPAADLTVIARPWALDFGSIKIPVLVWRGVRDGNVPVACGRYFANSIPRCHATFYADDAHLSVPINHHEDIFSALLAAGCR